MVQHAETICIPPPIARKTSRANAALYEHYSWIGANAAVADGCLCGSPDVTTRDRILFVRYKQNASYSNNPCIFVKCLINAVQNLTKCLRLYVFIYGRSLKTNVLPCKFVLLTDFKKVVVVLNSTMKYTKISLFLSIIVIVIANCWSLLRRARNGA